jgi:hypothetical protein
LKSIFIFVKTENIVDRVLNMGVVQMV